MCDILQAVIYGNGKTTLMAAVSLGLVETGLNQFEPPDLQTNNSKIDYSAYVVVSGYERSLMFDPRSDRACYIWCKNLALNNRDCLSLCLLEETLKAVGPFYLVSMPGEVKDHTRGKCVSPVVDSTF